MDGRHHRCRGGGQHADSRALSTTNRKFVGRMGLYILGSEEASQNIQTGDRLDVDLGGGTIVNLTQGKRYRAAANPEFMQRLLLSGGLMTYVRQPAQLEGKDDQ